jgi:hypothetical protein
VRASSSAFSLGGRSAAKIGTDCLVYDRDESCRTNICQDLQAEHMNMRFELIVLKMIL